MAGQYGYDYAIQPYQEDEYYYPKRGVTLIELIEIMWGQKWFMAMVFAVISILGALFALTLETTYTSQAKVLVRLSDDFIYNPVVGEGGGGFASEQERIMRGEVDIMSSRQVREELLDDELFALIDPEAAAKFQAADSIERMKLRDQAIEGLEKNFAAESSPKSDIIVARYTHTDPDVAAQVLGRWLATYQARRKVVFDQNDVESVSAQRIKLEVELIETEDKIQTIFDEHGVADLAAEQESAGVRLAELQTTLLDVQANRRATSRQVEVLQNRILSVPREVTLFTDDPTGDQIASLEVERERLLATYTANSAQVRKIDEQINRLRSFQSGASASGGQGRRGPNPVYQQLQSDLVRLEAEDQALAAQEAALIAQVDDTRARVQALRKLRPEFDALMRSRNALSNTLDSLAAREQEGRTRSGIEEGRDDAIAIVDPPRRPTSGESLKKIALALAVLFAGATAFAFGLLRGLVGYAWSDMPYAEHAMPAARGHGWGAPAGPRGPAPEPARDHEGEGAGGSDRPFI